MPRSVFVVVTILGALVLAAVVAVAALRDGGGEAAVAQADATPTPSAPTAASAASAPPDAAADTPPPAISQEDLLRCAAGDLDMQSGLGARDVPDVDTEQQIAEISDVVTDLRDLTFAEQPDPAFLDDAAIVDRLEDEITEEYDAQEADVDARLLAALGAVDGDIDLVETQTDLLTSQVAGFYDPDTGELVVRTGESADGLDAGAQTVLAHELQHALADQRLDLPIGVTEDVTDGDAALAALSVIEGDATLTQQQFTIVGLSAEEGLALFNDPSVAAAEEQLDQVPHYLRRSLEFPYLTGLEFACARYLDGGWDAVDSTYDQLPATSAEIMDPSRYPARPVDPPEPGPLGGDWERVRDTTLGAADLWWLFEAPGDDPSRALDDPRARALAWAGGELDAWVDGDETAVGIALAQRRADGPLCDSVGNWYVAAFPDSTDAPPRTGERLVRESDDQTAVLTCDGADVRLGIAPDLPTARQLVER